MLVSGKARSLLIRAAVMTAIAGGSARAQTTVESRWKNEALPLFETYCHDCHGDGIKKGELALDRFDSIAEMQQNREVWKRIRDHLKHRLMPPLDEEQPTAAEREKLLAWIDDAVFPVDPKHPDPGRVTLRRLNRVEYQNTLRDLLGVEVSVMDLIPPDDSGYGFDNIGDVLTLSPAHLERYLEAARMALDKAVKPGSMPPTETKTNGRDLKGNGQRSEEGHYLFKAGIAETVYRPLRPGKYLVTVKACGTPGGDGPPAMELHVEGKNFHEWKVDAPMDRPKDYSHEIRIEAKQPLSIGVAFTNDFYDENHPDRSRRDRNLMVNSITITGPLDGPPLPKPESHRRIFAERKPGDV